MSKGIKGDPKLDLTFRAALDQVELLCGYYKDGNWLKNVSGDLFARAQQLEPMVIELVKTMAEKNPEYIRIRYQQGPVSLENKRANQNVDA